jgi:hypothetical protein
VSYELQAKMRDIKSAPEPDDDSTVQYRDCSMIVQCRSIPYIDRIHRVTAVAQWVTVVAQWVTAVAQRVTAVAQ